MDRDIVAVGVGNLCSSMVGGLPMIPEIVHSKANIDDGARTQFAGLRHGLLLLLCVTLIPTVLHRIAAADLVERPVEQFTSMGATGFPITDCHGAGRLALDARLWFGCVLPYSFRHEDCRRISLSFSLSPT